MNIDVGAFQTADGTPTLHNIANLFQPSIMSACWISIRISFATALLGCLIGFGIAAAVTLGNLPGWLRDAVVALYVTRDGHRSAYH